MRGSDHAGAEALFSDVSAEARVPAGHPLRLIRAVVDEALDVLSGEFEALYARTGRPSVPPEKLIRALLLQAFFSIRSERQLMQQLDYTLLFRWFVGLSMDAPVWDATTFSRNRDRLLDAEIPRKLLAAVLGQPGVAALMSDEHFSVDGTLIQAWASHKSFKPKDAPEDPPGPGDDSNDPPAGRNAERNVRGEKRSNETHPRQTHRNLPQFRRARGVGRHRGLCDQPTHPQAHRGGVRLDQAIRRTAANQASRAQAGQCCLLSRSDRLQSRQIAQTPRSARLNAINKLR